jgi:hypothetical protein
VIDRLAELVNGDDHLVWLGRFLDVDFLVEVGDTPYHVRIERGRIAEVVEGHQLMRPWTFAIRASADAWSKFRAPVPEIPGASAGAGLSRHLRHGQGRRSHD